MVVNAMYVFKKNQLILNYCPLHKSVYFMFGTTYTIPENNCTIYILTCIILLYY